MSRQYTCDVCGMKDRTFIPRGDEFSVVIPLKTGRVIPTVGLVKDTVKLTITSPDGDVCTNCLIAYLPKWGIVVREV